MDYFTENKQVNLYTPQDKEKFRKEVEKMVRG